MALQVLLGNWLDSLRRSKNTVVQEAAVEAATRAYAPSGQQLQERIDACKSKKRRKSKAAQQEANED